MKKFLLLAACLINICQSQVLADFETNLLNPDGQTFKTFTVVFDHANTSVATANFMYLSGLEDEEWQGIFHADQLPAPHLPFSPVRPGRVYQQAGSVALNIVFQEASGNPGDIDKYVVRQNQTVLAITSTLPFGDVYQNITPGNPVEIHYDHLTQTHKIVIKHDHAWVDKRFFATRSDPMYRNIPVTKVEPGVRFFSGSRENNIFENPGYLFPEELYRKTGGQTPWGTDFNTGWVLAMDNYRPNSSGSRFFLTGQPLASQAANYREWNRRYTAFGKVLTDGGGRIVVNEILNLATNDDGTPITPARIRNITFRRGPDSSVVFFPHLFKQLFLPQSPVPEQLAIRKQGFRFFLDSSIRPRSVRTFLSSENLLGTSSIYTAYAKPGVFSIATEEITAALRTQPRSFYRSFTCYLPSWPAQDFDFSGKEITLSNVNPAGIVQGFIQLTFNSTDNPNLEATLGTYLMQLPAMTVDLGGGEHRFYPARSTGGSFTADLTDDEHPHQAVIELDNPQGTLPLDRFTLHFDHYSPLSLEERVSRFTAIDRDDPFYSFSGFWRKTN